MSESDRLLKVLDDAAEPALGGEVLLDLWPFVGDREQELLALLQARNGFYAFSRALHVFPAEPAPGWVTIVQWNRAELWRHAYGELATGHLFFAEDAFGDQFSIYENEICRFHAETGDAEVIAATVPNWLDLLVTDHRNTTGWPLLARYEAEKGPIEPGQRLMPALAFVLGGEYELSNLAAIDAVEAMGIRGTVAVQIRDLPDGASVHFDFTDEST